MKNIDPLKDLDLTKIIQDDLHEIFPNFKPLLVSKEEILNYDEERILELVMYAVHYKITNLKNELIKKYQNIYPTIFSS